MLVPSPFAESILFSLCFFSDALALLQLLLFSGPLPLLLLSPLSPGSLSPAPLSLWPSVNFQVFFCFLVTLFFFLLLFF
ncbi:hypothetical protein DEU56DRAFT_817191 [Suillus clintonianus]|uniref:uncharacterized protein n=1 Tax=Suillus clintonianus TaxID=1904413 RepID=UPI001B87E0F4|nr:uncharacterized protein DEU56DRAFT_817191 [Suillus clintonianus]KAG2129457.1 hypothetical protein DEU56DRAFT_817191 [Suillus clintonianus]